MGLDLSSLSLRLLSPLALSTGLAVAVAALPQRAEACGGTFCDSGPTAMPVDQTGETIVFVMGQNFVEAHIRIEYDPNTEATNFAWLVPVTQVPELSVGSERLFLNLLAGTVPTYGSTTTFDGCGDGGGSGGGGGTAGGVPIDGGVVATCDPVAQDCPNPDETCVELPDGDTACVPVLLRDTVGAFDVVVLGESSVEAIMQWLGDNGYQQDPAAEPILAQYLAEGYLFAAFKLTNGADTDTIHPITLRFPDSNEACIPLRLTRIAARNDMKVRTFFLGDTRVAPSNWRHVIPNPLRLDWSRQASNYDGAITFAVDELPANGRAFITEYAGASSTASPDGLWNPSWDPSPFTTLDPVQVIDELAAQGLAGCGNNRCSFDHPLILGLLGQFLPPPASVDAQTFYSCLSCYESEIDMAAWDGPAFSTALAERIVDPGRRARDLLLTWPYLTRLFATISPFEMTIDPFFHESFDLPPMSTTSLVATRRVLCSGDAVWTLPDGREVYLPSGASWPTFTGSMPWAETIELVPPAGAPFVDVDNTERIDVLLREYNCQFDWPSPEACGDPGGTDTGSSGGSSTSGGGATGGGTTGGGTTGPGGASTSGGDGGGKAIDMSRGCTCRATGQGSAPLGVWLAAFAFLFATRRTAPCSPRAGG